MAAACAIAWSAAGVPQSARAQGADQGGAQPVPAQVGTSATADTLDADMKDLPQPPPDATLPAVEPVIPDDQFNKLVPAFTPAEDQELNTPLESIEDFERRLDTPPAASASSSVPVKAEAAAAPPAAQAAAVQPVSGVPLDDQELAQPLPPLQSFQVEPVQIAGDSAKPAAKVRYRFEIDGLDKADDQTDADLRGLFDGVSSLKDGGGEAANLSQVRARLKQDAALLDKVLASEGWYASRVRTRVGAAADDAPDASPDVLSAVLDVDPGQRFTFATIDVKADPTVPPTLIADNFPLKVGEPIVADRVEAAEARVGLVLPQNGYPFAKVGQRDILLDRDTGTGDYTVPVEVGPRSKFGNIVIGGEGDDQVFTARHLAVISRFKRGELYDSRKIDDLNQALVATGLFASVSAKPVATGADAGDGTQYADIHVEQHKGPPRTIAGSAGYGTGEGIKVQASWTHRNLFPPEGALAVTATAGTQDQALGVTFTRSNAGKRDRTFQLVAEASHTDYAAVNGYTARLATRWSYDSTPIWRKTFSYAYGAQMLVTAEDDYDPAIADLSRRTFYIAGLTTEATLDLTDDLLNATKGFRLKAQVEPEASVHGGFHPYVRTRLEATGYVPFGSFVLAGRVAAGSIQGIARDDLAPSRRFYSGGGGSVRGYGYQELGPRVTIPNPDYDVTDPDEKDPPTILRPIGGRSFNEASIEARYRFGTYGVVAFVDAGQSYESTMPQLSSLQFGAGIGARYYTNFGPLRVDLATPLNKRPGDGWLAVYVSIGQAF